jgi:hypothetical protein
MHNLLPEINLDIPMPDCKPPKEDKTYLEAKVVFNYDSNGKIRHEIEILKERLDYLLSKGVDIRALLVKMSNELLDVLK